MQRDYSRYIKLIMLENWEIHEDAAHGTKVVKQQNTSGILCDKLNLKWKENSIKCL